MENNLKWVIHWLWIVPLIGLGMVISGLIPFLYELGKADSEREIDGLQLRDLGPERFYDPDDGNNETDSDFWHNVWIFARSISVGVIVIGLVILCLFIAY